ncbi:DsrE family protein [Parapedomonas caeni]
MTTPNPKSRHRNGLALVFSELAHARLHAGLSLACAAGAMGRPVRLFFHGESVAALEPHRKWRGDEPLAAAGIPTLADLLVTARELGIPIMACPSGLHLCHITANLLPEGVETAGMVAFLAAAHDDELLLA